MTPLPRLLRDSSLAVLVFIAVGQLTGHGAALAAGGIGGLVNLAGLVIACSGNPGALMGRLVLHNLTAMAVLYVLLTRFEPLPALLGLLAPLAAITVRTLMDHPPAPSPSSGVDR
jgi:hypothetical protein